MQRVKVNGEAAKAAWKAIGIKQGDVARLVGVSQPTISLWCHQRQTAPIDKVQKMADALCVEASTLILADAPDATEAA